MLNLQKINLTKLESSILEKLYQNDLLTASDLSKDLKHPKISIFYSLTKLERLNLIKKRTKGNTFIYNATSPENLTEIYQNQIESLQNEKENLIPLIENFKKIKQNIPQEQIYIYTKQE